ncbi:hypothetical protein SK629_1907 [Streptococcus mitis]|uniref:Uncharacterized protein n=1 Tax=Streptococcus mitis TaxID=28037 RepID=A0A081PTW0_STRMT|nr:hypothetical protein SK629_1907 [Streptococcus mitis]
MNSYTLTKSLQNTAVLSADLKQYFENSVACFPSLLFDFY